MNAKRRVGRIQALLAAIGLEPERVRMFNMSAAMAGSFVEAAKAMDETVGALGPNPLKSRGVGEKGIEEETETGRRGDLNREGEGAVQASHPGGVKPEAGGRP